MLSLFRILFQIQGQLITDTMIYNIGNKIQNPHFQECSLKNRSFWKLVISLEASFFDVIAFMYNTTEV